MEVRLEKSWKDLLKDELHYLVLTATDPTVAADLAQSYVFDLLILDLHMPKLDGFQVLDIVRRKQPAIKVMIITGLYEQYKDRLNRIRVDKVIVKPFDFPSFQADVLRVAGSVEAVSKPAETRLLPKAKILLVDDEKEQCQYLKEFLLNDQPSKYEVELAENAEEGIVKTNEFEPDLILFDIKMPHMRGDEMMDRIQGGDGHKPRLFVVISAIALPDTIERMEQKGCLYVTKPFRVDEVLALIRQKCIALGLTE